MNYAEKTYSKHEMLRHLLIMRASKDKKTYPLSYGQKALWFLYQAEPESYAYNLAFSVRIKSHIDISAIKRAFQKIINRHYSLRTTFTDINGEPVQTVHGYQELSFNETDVTYLNEEEIYQSVVTEHRRFFNLENGPLIRGHLFTCSPNNYILLITAHHIIMDFSSFVILNDELWQMYKNEINYDPDFTLAASPQYIDFVNWQRKLRENNELEHHRDYWLKKLSGELTTLNLPTDYTRPSIQTYNGSSIVFTISKNLTQKIKKCATEEGVTLFVFLLSVFQLFLHRYSGQNEVLVGIPTNGRYNPEFAKVIGYLINMHAIRTDFSENKTFKDLLHKVGDAVLNALKHQDYPFLLLVDQLQPKRDPSRSPIFQVTFEFLDISPLLSNERSTDAFQSMMEQYDISQQEGQFDIMLTLMDAGDSFPCRLNYNTDLFKKDTVADMVKHFKILMAKIAGNADKSIDDIQMMSEREIFELLQSNNIRTEYPRDKCIHQLFELQVQRMPDAIAASEGTHGISFGDLNKKSNQLARLLRKKGVGKDTIVGIMAKRSIELVISIIAVLKAGGAYLPIDHGYPQARKKYMLEDSRTGFLITQKAITPIEKFDGIQIYLDDIESLLEDSSDLECINKPHDLAYLIYTSGSTGMPKGAMIEHQGVVNYIHWAIKQYGREDRSGLRFPFYSSIAFDLTVTSLFVPLLSGNRMEIYDEDDSVLDKILKEDKVDIIKLTPSHLKTLLAEDYAPKNLRSLIIGGEELERALAAKISNKFNNNVILYNEYGPTETVVGCMIYSYDESKDKGRTIPIGVPVDNVQLYIFDQYQRLVPDNIIGELYIGGDGVCRGYLERKRFTNEKFIENPYVKGDRIYRTGDLVKKRNGIIEFIGRIDQQVKIRGYRIECAEVEGNILNIAGIDEAVLVIKESVNEEKILCCYYVSAAGMTSEQIRTILAKRLPDYMIPAIFIQKDSIPLTQNGKADRKLLQNEAINPINPEKYIAPRNRLEKKLGEIWKKVLRLKVEVGIYDDFFTLGGNSLLAIMVVQQARKAGIDAKAHTILRYPTIAGLAKATCKLAENEDIGESEIIQGKVELTPIQRWFFADFADVSHYNQYVVLKTKQNINKAYLEKALQSILIQHDMLRAYFIRHDSLWMQFIGEYQEYPILTTYDLTNMEGRMQYEKMQQIVAENQDKFDLAKPPLFWANYFSLGPNNGELVISMHHLITDYISFKIIIEDLMTAYDQLQNSLPIRLPNKTTSFQSWANALIPYAKKISFLNDIEDWCSGSIVNMPKLPVDYSGSNLSNNEKYRETYILSFDENETKNLVVDLAKKYSFRTHETIITCLMESLHQWTGNNRFLINFESHGRQEIESNCDLTRTVGWFTFVYPIQFTIDENDADPVARINIVKKKIQSVSDSGFHYGLLKYLIMNSHLENRAIPEIGFNDLGQLDHLLIDNAIFELKYLYTSSGEKNDLPNLLKIDSVIIDNRLRLLLSYSKNVFKQATISYLANTLKELTIQKIDLLIDKKKDDIVICKRCVLPSTFPGAKIDESGLCSYCKKLSNSKEKETNNFKDHNELKECLNKYKLNNKYDVLVPLSGGVDSCTTLIDIVNKYKLKALGFHNDHGYEDETATNNVKKLCKTLNVDLIIKQHDISFMKKLWQYTNTSSVKGLSSCFVCGGILYANAVELADKYKIPLIINGYSKGQAQMLSNKETALEFWEGMIDHFKQDEEFLAEFLKRQKPMSKQKVYLEKKDLTADVNYDKILVIPFYIFQFHKTDKKILKKKCKEIFDWQPLKTSYPGRTTNCEMVWLNTYMDIERINYTLYHEEYASLVRKGEISRDQALLDLEFHPEKKMLEKLANEIGLQKYKYKKITMRTRK